MTKYIYQGPVLEFDKCITDRWVASTYAISEKKARSNLSYQYKLSSNRLITSKISLPGKIMVDN